MSTMSRRSSQLVCPHCGKRAIKTYSSIGIFEHGYRYECPEVIPGMGFITITPITRAQYEGRRRSKAAAA